jgi:hypothetical protein
LGLKGCGLNVVKPALEFERCGPQQMRLCIVVDFFKRDPSQRALGCGSAMICSPTLSLFWSAAAYTDMASCSLSCKRQSPAVNRAHMAYDHGGLEALKPRPSGGRKRENMTLREEEALLARFAKAAGIGEMLNIHDLKAAYEKAIGHETSKSAIYNYIRGSTQENRRSRRPDLRMPRRSKRRPPVQ